MNVAAFIFAIAGVLLNFFQPVSNNYFGNALFGGFFLRYLESMGGFIIVFGIFSIVYIINQIMALFKGYHALQRRRDKNVVGFFKFTSGLCFVYAAFMYFVYSEYTSRIQGSGYYNQALFEIFGLGITPYVPMLLQVVCFGLAAALASADEGAEAETKARSTAQLTKTYEPIIGVETPALIKRGNLFLEEGNFYEAGRYFEQALNQDPENSRAYLGKLMAEQKVHNLDELSGVPALLQGHMLFQRAVRFASEDEKALLEGCIKAQEDKILNMKLEKEYAKAIDQKNAMTAINYPYEIRRVAGLFSTLGDYKDSQSIAESLRRLADEREEQNKISAARRKKFMKIFALIVIAGAAIYYGVGRYQEYAAAKRAEEERIARIEAEKQEEKSRIDALKLELQGQK